MTLVSITLVLAVFLFIVAPILTGWASGYLDKRAMYDVQIYSRYNNVYEEKNLPQEDYGNVTEFFREHDMKTVYDCTFYLYLPEKADFRNRMKYDFPVAAISLSDFNAIRETLYNSYTDVLYVFPDNVCESLLPVMSNRYIKTAETISYEDACELERLFVEEYPEQTDTGASYGIRLSTLQINSSKASNFVLQASMLYGAVVLMVICLTVLSLQQLLDTGKYKYRFSVLRKLGVEEQRIERLIRKQLSVWFGLPVTVAVGVATVVIVYFIQTISAEISAYIGFHSLLLSVGTTVGILLLLLSCYFLSTWILFKHSVHS